MKMTLTARLILIMMLYPATSAARIAVRRQGAWLVRRVGRFNQDCPKPALALAFSGAAGLKRGSQLSTASLGWARAAIAPPKPPVCACFQYTAGAFVAAAVAVLPPVYPQSTQRLRRL